MEFKGQQYIARPRRAHADCWCTNCMATIPDRADYWELRDNSGRAYTVGPCCTQKHAYVIQKLNELPEGWVQEKAKSTGVMTPSGELCVGDRVRFDDGTCLLHLTITEQDGVSGFILEDMFYPMEQFLEDFSNPHAGYYAGMDMEILYQKEHRKRKE